MRKIFLGVVVVVGLLVIVKVLPRRIETDGEKKLQVVTSFYPLYFMALEIGGEKADVYNITPVGAEPHDFEPSVTDIAKIERSDVLLINGVGLEPWGNKFGKALKVAEEIAVDGDPHTWLDPVLLKQEAGRMYEEFIRVDPANQSYYKLRADKLNEELDRLDGEFRRELGECNNRVIVTAHTAFGYLAKRYNLRQTAIAGVSPDTEPSLKELAEIVEFARSNKVSYIFFETLVSPKLAETIASEVGAKTLVLDPIESAGGDNDYFSLQRQNLTNLKIALECYD